MGHRRSPAPKLAEEVAFPVTPFLDMAFQLLAFFILTFRPPSHKARIDLDLPTAPAALPESPRGRRPAVAIDDPDLEADLVVTASADDRGNLASLLLGPTRVKDADDLQSRLKRYGSLLGEKPLRVRLVAPDSLRFEEAARLIAACSSAGVASLRLGQGGDTRP